MNSYVQVRFTLQRHTTHLIQQNTPYESDKIFALLNLKINLFLIQRWEMIKPKIYKRNGSDSPNV